MRRSLDWQADALCAGDTTTVWVPTVDKSHRAPRDIETYCRPCPVRTQCLWTALETKAAGYWAGTNSYQRDQLSRTKDRRTCPSCKSRDLVTIFEDRAHQMCVSCGISWKSPRKPTPPTNATHGRAV
jgi:hypothetical protein